jgi:signal transduction histidine kinase/HAMP domain-containing protein
MTISLHPDTAGSPGLAAAPGSEAAPPTAESGRTIRSRLFIKYVALFVGVVSLALISNGIFEVFFYYGETKSALIRIQHEQAEAAAAKIGQFVKEIESQLGWTTQLPWSAASLEQRRFDALRLLRQVPAITELAQIDSAGKERLRVSRLAMDVVDSGLDLSADPKFTEAMAHKVYYGPVYFRRESEPYMTLALAGTRKDAGVSIAEVNLKLIVDVVSQIKVGEKGQAYVVDTQGRLIAHPDISLVLRNTDMSKLKQVQAARAGGGDSESLQAFKNLQGQDVLSASAPINPLGWTIFVELPVEEAFAPLYTALQRLAFVLFGALAFAALAGLFLARRMIVPIQALRVGAALIGGGNFSQRIQIKTGDELESLANQFNEMGAKLQESYADLENKVERRTAELKETLDQQTATSEVLQVISSSTGDVEPVFQKLLENATRVCGAEFGTMLLHEDGKMSRVARYNAPAAYDAEARTNVFAPRPDSALGTVIRTRQVVQVHDLRETKPYLERDPAVIAIVELAGARTLVTVPMLRDEELIGVIAIYRQEVRPFSEKQIELLKNFASQAVIAIENTRLIVETREALEQQTATAEVLGVINASRGDLMPVFKAMVERAVHLCKADSGHLALPDGEDYRTAVVAAMSPEMELLIRGASFSPGRGTAVGRALLEKRPVQIDDVHTDSEHVGPKGLIRTILGVPLLREGEPIGAFGLSRSRVEPFTEREVELVRTFADQAVIAIENTRLLKELRARTDDLGESLQQQTATADVLKIISRSTFDLQTVLQTLVESAARLADADNATITRQRDGAFYRFESYGFSEEFMKFIRANPMVPERGSASGRALLEGTVVHIPDVKADQEYTFNEAQRLGDFRAILAVPMLREGSPVGVIVLTRTEPRAFTDKQIELVTTFADQAAIAIENVRLFDQVQAQTQELSQSLDDLRTAQDRLVQTEKLASLGQLTAGIAHEIKNPLNFVNNFSALSAELIDELLEVLGSTKLPGKAKEEVEELTHMLKGNLEKVVQHGKRADSIVKNMLLHSREGSGEHRPVEINAVVDESLNLAYHGARAEKSGFNITLERKLDPDAGLVDIYPQEMTRVFLNLISNGFYAATKRKASAGDGFEPTLTASTKNLGNAVEVRIRDNGTGIPPEVKEKMFNPFFTTKPAGEGTGLGLSMSHDIVVKQHGGRMDVATEPDVFTEFIITLPRAAAAVQSGSRT